MTKDILYPLRRLHGKYYEWNRRRIQIRRNCKDTLQWINTKKAENPNSVFLVMTPEHGNLGDHAIAYAEQRLLDRIGVSYIELTVSQLSCLQKCGSLRALDGTPVLINGGGNLGTIWSNLEQLHKQIVRANPNSPIIIFPNTAFYEHSFCGKKALNQATAIYNAHPSLILCTRERISYDLMKSVCKNVQLIPDMVLSLNRCAEHTSRNGCLLCLRSDREKTRTDKDDAILFKEVENLFGEHMFFTDMNINHTVSISERESVLEQKYAQIRSAELVVTDRLHGMIFCAVTGTPCIVIDSQSPKLRGCYEWIKDLGYIRFADDPSQISSLYADIPKAPHRYSSSHLKPYFDELENDILTILQRR